MNGAGTQTAYTGGFTLSDREFQMFRDLIFEKSGINLHDGKKELLRTRLGKRLRSHGINTFREYYDFVRDDRSGDELVSLLDAISTNITSFFREINHFNFLRETVIPETLERKKAPADQEFRVWSAGCSSGEEPYSLAFTLLEDARIPSSNQVKILATDISLQMLERAAQGLYPEERVGTVPAAARKRFFEKAPGDTQNYRVREEARRVVHFKRFNLMTAAFPFKRRFDLIFCRNVMIYFDKPTQEALVNKFYQALANGGYLMIGHSESLTGIQHKFRYIRPTIYKRMD